MIKISKEVQEALKNNIPVVALESTIISHGMPYPKNVETALNVERIIIIHREKNLWEVLFGKKLNIYREE